MRLVPLLALCAVLLAGCGGESDPMPTTTSPGPEPDPKTAAARVRADAQKLIDTHDSKVVCAEMVTTGFIDEVFDGDRKACVASSVADASHDGSTQRIGRIEVDGARASVEVLQRGGVADGKGGHFRFVVDGDTWKLDGFAADYLRTVLSASLEQATRNAKGTTAAVAYPPLQQCMAQQFAELPDAKVKAFVYATLRQDGRAQSLGNDLIEACPQQLTAYVVDTILDVFAKQGDASPAFVKCARRYLDTTLLATGLSKRVLKGNTTDASTEKLKAIVRLVTEACIA
jgi:hypothetical protein